jgi:hypothetical protein
VARKGSHSVRTVVAVTAAVAALIGTGTAGAAVGPSRGVASAAALAITVQPGAPGNPLSPGFVGLSFGAATVAADNYADTDLAGYLRTLGPGGVIRIGGNSGDTTFWTSTGEPAPAWATGGTITPADLQPLAAIVKSAGWRVVLAVNLKEPDPARAADEAKYAQQIFGRSLLGIEIGNEPNFYYSDVSAYYAEFETYAAAIEQAAPGVGLTGPDPDTNHSAFLTEFAADEAAHPDVKEVTQHAYPTSVCGTSTTSIPALLGTGSVQYENADADALVAAGQLLHVPAAMTETNSTVCAGAPGVSNVFASSLWALDYIMLLAQDGVANAEFMGGTNAAGCDPYSPLCPTTGDLTVQPIYYGMVAARLVGTGRFVSVANPDSADMRAYAVRNGGRLTVVLDDVQDPASNGSTTVSLNLGSYFRLGWLTALTTSSSAGLSATTGITLGGQQVGPHGSLAPLHSTPIVVHGRTATVTVPAGSAAIIQFN